MKKGTVLTIDDDENLQIVVRQYLEGDGYNVIAANDSQSALEKLDSALIDVVLLDLVLPDGEGLTLIPQIQQKCQSGIIVVSGKSDTTEKIVCLEMGADDYITKPFEMRELSARIKAILRRTEHSDDAASQDAHKSNKKKEKVNFGNGWCLDRTQYQVFDGAKKSVDLTTGEFKLLEALVMSPNRAISREQLFELTRDGEFDSYDRAIDIQIGRLRKKIHDKSETPMIKTVRGVGYMFCDTVN